MPTYLRPSMQRIPQSLNRTSLSIVSGLEWGIGHFRQLVKLLYATLRDKLRHVTCMLSATSCYLAFLLSLLPTKFRLNPQARLWCTSSRPKEAKPQMIRSKSIHHPETPLMNYKRELLRLKRHGQFPLKQGKCYVFHLRNNKCALDVFYLKLFSNSSYKQNVIVVV